MSSPNPKPPVTYSLSFEGYDYEHSEEVSITVNGQTVTVLPITDSPQNNDTWVPFIVDITRQVVSGTNNLTFIQNIGSSMIRNVIVTDSNGTTLFSDPTERSMWISTTTSSRPSVTYSFESSPPSISYNLSFEGFDFDHTDEVAITVNGQRVTVVPGRASPENNDAWVSFSFDISRYVVSGNNTLTFEQNTPGHAKNRNVTITDSKGTILLSDPAERSMWLGSASSNPSITYTFVVP